MKVLELFAGSKSVGKVAENLNFEVFSTDKENFEGIDLAISIEELKPSMIPFVPSVIWASPPCTYFSVASIGKHWNKDNTPKTENALKGVSYVEATLKLIKHFLELNPDLKWFIENPRGKLRKLKVMEGLPKTTVWYCKYGDIRAKPTDIWSNHIRSIFNQDGWSPRSECFNGNKNCHHQPAPRGSSTGTQGIKGSYNRSKIPTELCNEILSQFK